MRYGFIRDHRSIWPLRVMCRVLEVSPSGYYAWRGRPQSPRIQRRVQLRAVIREVHGASRRIYGSPRVHAALAHGGVSCCVNTVARIMREDGLRAKTKRKFKATTNSSHDMPVAANLLDRQFRRDRPNEAWVADITFIPTEEGWLYLATEMDLYSRRIVGWAMSDRMTSDLVIQALAMALKQRRPAAGLIHHSDRGSQYASEAFQKELRAQGLRCSMSRKADVYDNAVAESFFGTLKRELVSFAHYQTRSEARQSIFEYIEVFYNRTRIHSTLDYLSPVAFEGAA
jgi:putative transposase